MTAIRTCILVLICAFALAPRQVVAQTDHIDLSSLLPGQRFDFLVGDWTYSFDGGSGKVRYAPAVDGSVIRESLEGQINGSPFAGSSLITHSNQTDEWTQQWIDSFGTHLLGTAEMAEHSESDLPAMVSVFESDGTYFKHVWYDITQDRFETDLLVSSDGVSYRLARRAPYVRVRDTTTVPEHSPPQM